MSHLKERSEKNCLNCNAQVLGRYCHICGQENVVTYETAWQMVVHFFQDITHYDGKFVGSIRYLLTKPGFLTTEYMAGRRASYLHPIRMYVFTSAIFFIIFFSISGSENIKSVSTYSGKTDAEIALMDSTTFSAFTQQINGGKPMTRAGFEQYKDSVSRRSGIHFTTSKFASKAQYDSALQSGKVKHNWLKRTMVYKDIEINEKYQKDQKLILASFKNTLVHSFPQLLFISLPLFALILKWLYWRRKSYFYVSHAVFGVHLYVFLFLILLIVIGINKLIDATHQNWLDYLLVLLTLYIFYYEYKAMRVFYGQGRAKTILKFFILNVGHFIVLAFLMIFFVFFSLLKL